MRDRVWLQTTVRMLGVTLLSLTAYSQTDATTRLFTAIEQENIPAVRSALAAGASCAAHDQHEYIPLTDAAQEGNVPVFLVVLDGCPKINAQDGQGHTALITAVWLQQWDVLRVLLERHANLDLQDERGSTALFYAERSDDGHVTDMLIRAGANVNLVDKTGHTVLSQAIQRSWFKVAKLLRDAGGTFASPNDEMTGAASTGDIATLTRLLDQEHADANFHLRFGQSVLCIAAQKGNTVAVRVLLAHGADPNLRDSNHQPPLYWALTSGHVSTAQALIDAHADLLAETPGHRTLLSTAAYSIDNTDLLQVFINAGVSVNQPDVSGTTALMNAASSGVEVTVRFLLGNGADPRLRDRKDKTAANYALQRNNSALAMQLEQAEDKWTADKH